MKKTLSAYLNELDVALEDTFGQSAVSPLLHSGLSRAEINEKALRLLPYLIPEDLRCLYMWHDGMSARRHWSQPLILFRSKRHCEFISNF